MQLPGPSATLEGSNPQCWKYICACVHGKQFPAEISSPATLGTYIASSAPQSAGERPIDALSESSFSICSAFGNRESSTGALLSIYPCARARMQVPIRVSFREPPSATQVC